jgi:methylmalonyl-CoA mutase
MGVATREDWLALAGDVDALVSTTYDGIEIAPLYTADDRHAGESLPGFAPFVRGRRAAATREGWDVRALVDAGREPGAAVAELERGATSIWLQLGDRAPDLPALLDGVLLDVAPIVLDAGRRWPEAATLLTELWGQAGDPAAVTGSWGADPYGDWTAHRDDALLESELRALAAHAVAVADAFPGVNAATVDGRRFHDLGASDAQELGYSLAVVVDTLRALPDDLDLATAFRLLELRLSAGVDQFATTAKFRAARLLLARVADLAGVPEAAGGVPLHAVTSRAMATRYDPATNMLRATVACFAAAVGGADAITVLAHDSAAGAGPSELGRRLARNTQSVLALESNVARVIDPGGGSWYLETLTERLAERAWDHFQEVESSGGFVPAIAAGTVDERIADVRRRRDDDVDHLHAPIVGVTAFPSAAGDVPATVAAGGSAVARWARRFEALRARVDDVAAASGQRPAVFLAVVGSQAAAAARVTAAANYFGIAGLLTPRGRVDEFAASAARVACICADDATELADGDAARAELVAAGAGLVYSAAELGDDARATLAELLDVLAVP